MSKIKRVLPAAFNNKEKAYQVKLSAPVLLKRGGMGVNCYIEKGAPFGRYQVSNIVVKAAMRAYEISAQTVIIGERTNDFNLILKNIEGADYTGSLYFEINEVIAQAVSF